VASVVTLLLYAATSELDNFSLASDLLRLRRVYTPEFQRMELKNYTADDVQSYYTHTTNRDYRLLRKFVGEGHHTRLSTIFSDDSHFRTSYQSLVVYAECLSKPVQRVLEVGCGRGRCSLLLGQMLRTTSFVGVDNVELQISAARDAAYACAADNVSFEVCDATRLGKMRLHQEIEPFDMIFGVESLCHMDTETKAAAFMEQAASLLSPGGRLVIIDGFRSSTFDTCSDEQRMAMLLAESGFRINAMPAMQQWVLLAKKNGLRCVRNLTFTDEALPFWELGWRISRPLLLFPGLLRLVSMLSVECRETVSTLLSVSTVAHAMRNGAAAEYGYLVFERQNL
tara:strand:+ start:191 stop:1210 length:1020 start_codon:yes stop_codon:yes gene_type:complete